MSQSQVSFNDYEGFVEKFKPKKTTDDCYTPPEVYQVVLDYCAERWGIDPDTAVRPFWPGGDYEAFDYPEGCTVIDNPPFSILARIQSFYIERGIRFFLFAPALTCLSSFKVVMQVDHIVCNADIEYANGAKVRTGFITNLEESIVLESDPVLGEAVNATCRELAKAKKKTVTKYQLPNSVLTAARCQWLAAHGEPFKVRREDCCAITRLDGMPKGKGIFGGALLLSERAAAERAAAEVYLLSEREERLQAMLGVESC